MAAPEHSSLEIKLGRVDRVYKPGEVVTGTVSVSSKGSWSHSGVSLAVVGQAKLQV